MTNSIVWCMMTVALNCGLGEKAPCLAETAVKGRLIQSTIEWYLVDFSEYAKKQKYQGNWSEIKMIDPDKCILEYKK